MVYLFCGFSWFSVRWIFADYMFVIVGRYFFVFCRAD